jgi:hypothetical protein
VFESYVRSWLADSEPPTPDISRVPIKQWELLVKALEEQEQIGWDLGIGGYLSRHWSLAVATNPRLPPKNVRERPGLERQFRSCGISQARCVNIKMPFYTMPSWKCPGRFKMPT